MTREEAYYLKMLLQAGYREAYEEELTRFLETEEPISDIALELAFCGSDVDKCAYELGCYCSEGPFDEDKACEMLRRFLKQLYDENQMTREEASYQMYRFALQHEDIFSTDSEQWYCMYLMEDYYYLAESSLFSESDFKRDFLAFLNDGTIFELK